MAYRFRSADKSVTDAVRRIAASEFDMALKVLADDRLPAQRQVHEVRKATKRLRALLRLVRPVMPGAAAEIAALRDTARRLSDLRDAGALIETLGRLDLAEDDRASLAEALASRPEASPKDAAKRLAACTRALRRTAARARGWTLTDEGWDALEPGLIRSHERLDRARRMAKSDTQDEAVHDLRKRAKDHWYQTLLIRRAFPDVMAGYAEAGERLCNDLGDWRDFAQLEAALRALPGQTSAVEEALAQIPKRRKRALKQAFQTARLITVESPGAYAARIGAWWNRSR
jgi:CHAD domain-containing protein